MVRDQLHQSGDSGDPAEVRRPPLYASTGWGVD